jgi:hypothetical protein
MFGGIVALLPSRGSAGPARRTERAVHEASPPYQSALAQGPLEGIAPSAFGHLPCSDPSSVLRIRPVLKMRR